MYGSKKQRPQNKNHPMFGKHHSEKSREKMSLAQKKRFSETPVWNKGKRGTFKQTEETKKRISEANKGTNNYDWKGEGATYRAIHHWVEKWKGKPKQCENCGKVGEIIKGKWSIDWANVDHKYRRVLEDYVGMCKKCHGECNAKLNLNKR